MTVCHICSAGLHLQETSRAFLRVTSDSRPWRAGGRLGVCTRCGAIQSAIDARWRAEAEEIYAGYRLYHQSGGKETAVFDQSGGAVARSVRLLERLKGEIGLPPAGRLLDVGCGSGVTLRAASRLLPSWRLLGSEMSGRTRAEVEAIPGVECLHVGAAGDVPGTFDLITISHVLEHVVDPVALLRSLRPKLAPGGLLLVQVPDARGKPFDYLIADHCTQFDCDLLRGVAQAAGFAAVVAASDWVSRELTLVARGGGTAGELPARDCRPWEELLDGTLSWLASIRALAQSLSRDDGPLGIFGTAIGGTWLAQEVSGRFDFFVDEDESRGTFMDKPVLHPRAVPHGARVIIAVGAPVAGQIARRLATPEVGYIALDAMGSVDVGKT